jgi:hypothetical protein
MSLAMSTINMYIIQVATVFTTLVLIFVNPASAGVAGFRLFNGSQGLHQYLITSFTRNIHGMVLNITWDNGIKSIYYLGRGGDLLVDDGHTGTWDYNSVQKSLILNVRNVGIFSFDLSSKDFSQVSRYYWDSPIDLCRDSLTGRPVSDYKCQ